MGDSAELLDKAGDRMTRKRKRTGTKMYRRQVGVYDETSYRMFGGKKFWLSKRYKKKNVARGYANLCRLDGHNARIAKVGKKWHVYESHARSKKWKKRYG